jgi:hypothetical protein
MHFVMLFMPGSQADSEGSQVGLVTEWRIGDVLRWQRTNTVKNKFIEEFGKQEKNNIWSLKFNN